MSRWNFSFFIEIFLEGISFSYLKRLNGEDKADARDRKKDGRSAGEESADPMSQR